MRIAIIGGTGIGEKLLERMSPTQVETFRPDTPFGWPSSEIVVGRVETASGRPIDLMLLNRHGSGHRIPPHRVPYRANVFALKQLGATHIVATGAVGSLREEIAPGQIVLCDQFIDRTIHRARTFFDNAAVHVEFADPVCPVLHRWLATAASSQATTVHESGTYVCIEGPSFGTRAESEMHRSMGAHVVGMTALPEARLAREAELPYALVALPTDYDCWRKPAVVLGDATANALLSEIIDNLDHAVQVSFEIIERAMEDIGFLEEHPSPATRALELAIWTDKTKIRPGEVDRFAPFWAKYFDLP